MAKKVITFNGTAAASFVINCDLRPQGMIYKGCEELQSALHEIVGYKMPIIRGYDNQYKYRIIVKEGGEDLNYYCVKIADDNNVTVFGGHGYSVNAALHLFAEKIRNVTEYFNDFKTSEIISGSYNNDTSNTGGYKLVFSDEFDGTALDPAWKLNEWENKGCRAKIVKDECRVENGSLVLTSRKTTLDDGKPGYTGIEMFRNDFTFGYGYFEIRAKLSIGGGTQSAFWSKGLRKDSCGNDLKEPYAGEIDVFETFGSDVDILSCLHTWWKPNFEVPGLDCTKKQLEQGHIQHMTENSPDMNGGMRYYPILKADETSFADDWHTYGCEWTPTYIKYYCDGYNYATVDISKTTVDEVTGKEKSQYEVIKNGKWQQIYFSHCVMEHPLVKPINTETEFPSKFCVDYVHLYQIPETGIYTKIIKE